MSTAKAKRKSAPKEEGRAVQFQEAKAMTAILRYAEACGCLRAAVEVRRALPKFASEAALHRVYAADAIELVPSASRRAELLYLAVIAATGAAR